MPHHPADTPARQVYRALRLLEELEHGLRVPASSKLGRRDHVVFVVAARRRLRLAAAALRSTERRRDGVIQQLVSVGSAEVKGVVFLTLGAGFLLRLLSRSLRGALRLFFILRAI